MPESDTLMSIQRWRQVDIEVHVAFRVPLPEKAGGRGARRAWARLCLWNALSPGPSGADRQEFVSCSCRTSAARLCPGVVVLAPRLQEWPLSRPRGKAEHRKAGRSRDGTGRVVPTCHWPQRVTWAGRQRDGTCVPPPWRRTASRYTAVGSSRESLGTKRVRKRMCVCVCACFYY